MNPENPSPAPVTLPITVPIAIIGGGPAGLMAAQVLSDAGLAVHRLTPYSGSAVPIGRQGG
jgi:NADPH-dependent glutamate synthase beta subunit-like oxidoreductase